MEVIVQKYGGSSVASIQKIQNIAKNIIERKEKNKKIVVVVSAMGDTTDDLLKMANKISECPDKRELDALLSTGEMISSSLLAMALKNLGQDAISLNAYQVQIKTDGRYGKSLIQDLDEKIINKYLEKNKVVIITGFQGVSNENNITTLGRGGSDTSAVAIAIKLKAICEIYTDVDGIYTVDPRIFKNAKKLECISYEEMLELSSLGAQVMHSRSIELAHKYQTTLYVAKSCSKIKGTYIRGTSNMESMENKIITGIAVSDSDISISLENIEFDINLLSNIFENIANEKINVDMISQTSPFNQKISLSFTIPSDEKNEALSILEKLNLREFKIDESITKFSVVGIGMKTTSGVAAKIFKIFKENNISIKMITTSEIKITCAIDKKDKQKAVELVAKEFYL